MRSGCSTLFRGHFEYGFRHFFNNGTREETNVNKNVVLFFGTTNRNKTELGEYLVQEHCRHGRVNKTRQEGGNKTKTWYYISQVKISSSDTLILHFFRIPTGHVVSIDTSLL